MFKHFRLYVLLCMCEFLVGLQTRYKVIQQNVNITYADPRCTDVKAKLLKVNGNRLLNLTLQVYVDLPENTKMLTKVYRMFGDRRIFFGQGEQPLKIVLQAELFGMQALCMTYTRPPLTWPLQKKVTYHLERWAPESTTFPPNVPEGLYDFDLIIRYANQTRVLIINWLAKVDYEK